MTPEQEKIRAQLLEDLARAKAQGHTVQAWKIKTTIAGFDMAVEAARKEQTDARKEQTDD